MALTFSIDKKLIVLVMVVAGIALSISAFLSFNYADEILRDRTGDQLISESTIRGNSIELLFETRIKETQILATDPMIQILVDELNQAYQKPDLDEQIKELSSVSRCVRREEIAGVRFTLVPRITLTREVPGCREPRERLEYLLRLRESAPADPAGTIRVSLTVRWLCDVRLPVRRSGRTRVSGFVICEYRFRDPSATEGLVLTTTALLRVAPGRTARRSGAGAKLRAVG